MARFKAYVEKHGDFEPRVMEVETRCAIEKIAIRTVIHYVEAHSRSARSAAVH